MRLLFVLFTLAPESICLTRIHIIIKRPSSHLLMACLNKLYVTHIKRGNEKEFFATVLLSRQWSCWKGVDASSPDGNNDGPLTGVLSWTNSLAIRRGRETFGKTKEILDSYRVFPLSLSL